MIRVVAIRAGRVQQRESPRGLWTSAIEKHVVSGPVKIYSEGIEGDEQADRVNHGGPEKAILGYSLEHYVRWREELNWPDFGPGAMGENLDIEGQTESDVCIGDSYSFGSAVLQVSQPRQPCWKPAAANGIPTLTRQIALKGRTGWYFRVLREGSAEAPAALTLLRRSYPEWSIARANRLVYLAAEDDSARVELASLPDLSEAWKDMLLSRSG